MDKRQYKFQLGFSLIEILIALVITTFGIVALLSAHNLFSKSNTLAAQMNEANRIGSNKLEDLRDFVVIATTSGLQSYQDIASGKATVNGATAQYTLNWTVTEDTSLNYKTIDVAVSWNDNTNTSRQINLSTRVNNLDPASSGLIMQNN